NFDTLEIQIEMRDGLLDSIGDIEVYRSKAKMIISSAIGVGINVKLVDNKSLARSMGKAVRVMDKRKEGKGG
ncbi:MAG: phenylacetate--CoA ligase, partial [Oscillospiraceae bacterium]|nr:phenylacetate--CoA ligase [Oscillospiraceae bacterium]